MRGTNILALQVTITPFINNDISGENQHDETHFTCDECQGCEHKLIKTTVRTYADSV